MKNTFTLIMLLLATAVFAQTWVRPSWSDKNVENLTIMKELAPDDVAKAQVEVLLLLAQQQTVVFADVVSVAASVQQAHGLYITFTPNIVKAYVVAGRHAALIEDCKAYIVTNPTQYDLDASMTTMFAADPTWVYAIITRSVMLNSYSPLQIQRAVNWLVKYTPIVSTPETLKGTLEQLNNIYTAKLGENTVMWADTVAMLRTVLLNYTK